MIDPTTRVQRGDRVVFRNLAEGGGVLLHLDTTQYHGVNELGAVIWELAETGPSFEALIESLTAKLEDPPADLVADVQEFLNDLAERNLVELGTATAPDDTAPAGQR